MSVRGTGLDVGNEQFAIGRTAKERMLWEDLKQVLREQAIA